MFEHINIVLGRHLKTDEAISKSIGGNSSKTHMMVGACGNPCEFLVTDGTTHDVKVAPELLSKVSLKTTEYVSADKGYDSDSLREMITQQSTKAVIAYSKETKYDS